MYSTLMLSLLIVFAQNGPEYYQQALVQERAAGNLEAAIQLYQDAARYAGNDRALAAQALMGAARCYEKLGQAKARELYEEIAKTYPDQQAQASAARQRLAAVQPHEMRTIVRVDENTRADVARELAIFRTRLNEVYEVAPGMFWTKKVEFDPGKPIVIKGTVSQVVFVNPSMSLSVQVTEADGKIVTYAVKGGAPNTVIRNGFTPQSLRPGDLVTVEGLRAKDPELLMIGMATLTLPDGRKIFLGESVSGQ